MVDTPDEVSNTNIHNTTIWHAPDGASHLLFPANDANKVFVTGLDGKIDAAFPAPDSNVDLGNSAPNDYFKSKGKFLPTDVERMVSSICRAVRQEQPSLIQD
jgi:hypothetical protein